MDYSQLQRIAKTICQEAQKENILSRMYWYTPTSRKIEPISKIGYYETKPTKIHFDFGCKLILVFPRLAFDVLKPIINSYLLQDKHIAYREDYKCEDGIGFDVYQRVNKLNLFIEPDQKESKSYSLQQVLKQREYWNDRQLFALQDAEPQLPQHVIEESMKEVETGFQKALAYLENQTLKNPQAKLQIRRVSGVRHRMVRINWTDERTKRVCFGDLVIVFSASKYLPEVTLPKAPNVNRKPRSDSMSAQYKANPSSFKYYDNFGIFEVYDK